MILRALLVGTFIAAITSAANADCGSETDFVTGLLRQTGYSVVDEGEKSESNGQCRVAGLVLREDNIQLEIEEIKWAVSGIDALETGEGTVALEVDLDNLRMVPQMEDPWFDYMMREQNRRSLIDGRLSASWDFGSGVFSLRELVIDLPGKNRVSLSSRTEGMSPDLLTGAMGSLGDVALAAFDLEIENHGFLDGAVLGYLVGNYSGSAGTPEAVVDGAKKQARAWVADLPDAAFPPSSKAALNAMIDDAPVPWGVLNVSIESDAPINLAMLPGMGIVSGLAEPATLEEALSGAYIDVRFELSEGVE
ncbi:MAG: hypothetical protein ACR2O1_07095 [Boseongicola sp.]